MIKIINYVHSYVQQCTMCKMLTKHFRSELFDDSVYVVVMHLLLMRGLLYWPEAQPNANTADRGPITQYEKHHINIPLLINQSNISRDFSLRLSKRLEDSDLDVIGLTGIGPIRINIKANK
jgi:hypothetical protein